MKKNYVLIREEKFFFDYLILASGSYYHSPIKRENVSSLSRFEDLMNVHDKIKEAKKIVVIGGGAVGVEISSELITKYPKKNISVFTYSKTLLERNNERTKFLAKDFLLKKGVKIFFEKEVFFNRGIFLKNKKKVDADYFFVCTGIRLNNEFLKKSSKIILNKRGGISVNNFLQVNGSKNIFAGGDLTGISEEKTAQTAIIHAKVISNNIINLERGKNLKKYAPKKRPMVIFLGRLTGIFEYGNFSIRGFPAAILKKLIEIRELTKFKINL